MASRTADRLLTIVITATLTSAAWIVVGSLYVDLDGSAGRPAPERTEPEAQVDPAPAAESQRVAAEAAGTPSQLVIPVLNVSAAQLTDSFFDGREEGERLHEALDIMAPAGTSVIAAAPGRIERLFRSEAGGNTIYVRSTDRQTIHYYAHLQDYAPGLREGQQVRRGQRLGTVGSSGNAEEDAPHLHFAILRTTPEAEWWEPSRAINPYPLLGGR